MTEVGMKWADGAKWVFINPRPNFLPLAQFFSLQNVAMSPATQILGEVGLLSI